MPYVRHSQKNNRLVFAVRRAEIVILNVVHRNVHCFSAFHPLKYAHVSLLVCFVMMTSSNGNIFRVTGHLCGDRWIPLTKPSDAQLWCFLWSAPQQTVEQTMETSVIRDAIALIKMKNVCMIREMYCDLAKLKIQSVSIDAFLTSRQIPTRCSSCVTLSSGPSEVFPAITSLL